jgi:hypothetical protein
MLIWAAYGEQWAVNHKVTFDGVNRKIIVSPYVDSIDVKANIYSDWKEWVRLYDNSKFLPAIRTIGGDPVGGGLFAGDIYFLINGWKVEVASNLTVNGILYDDSGGSPYIILPGGSVRATVSNLAYAVSAGSANCDNTEVLSKLEEVLQILGSVSTEQTTQAALQAAKLAAALSV